MLQPVYPYVTLDNVYQWYPIGDLRLYLTRQLTQDEFNSSAVFILICTYLLRKFVFML